MSKYKITLYYMSNGDGKLTMTFKVKAQYYHDVMQHARNLKERFGADDYTVES